MSELEDYAERHFGSMQNYAVPLHLLRAWLVRNESEHPNGGESLIADSLALDEWARENAVKRVVDKKDLGGDDKDIWYFHEHGWHKAGIACHTQVSQSEARITRYRDVTPDVDVPVVKTGKPVVTVVDAAGWKHSVTTRRWHKCYLPEGEDCYWSGDPYASHEIGY